MFDKLCLTFMWTSWPCSHHKETYLETTERHENGKFRGSQEPCICQEHMCAKEKAIPFAKMNSKNFQA